MSKNTSAKNPQKMRYYRLDGTYKDCPLDNEFGWYFDDIAIDEATPTFQDENENIKEISRLQRSISEKCCRKCDSEKTTSEASGCTSVLEESVDVLENLNPKPTQIYKIEPNIKEETPTNSIVYQQSVEGFVENPESNFLKQVKNCKIPAKEDMIALINPVNPETKALLSVISYSRYKTLNDKETNEDVLKTINFKTSNSKHLINERDYETSPFRNGNVNFLLNDRFPEFNFMLNDNEVDADQQLASEIQNYHATKEDNMLSLMMELIITDMDSSLGDMSELNNSVNELNNMGTGTIETSDLGNSIQSSIVSKEASGFREKSERKQFLDIPNRSDVLSSIGLSDDIDRSIEIFANAKAEMHLELVDIKKSFEADEKKIDTLINQAAALQTDLRETTYLNNLIHLLNGEPEKVKNKKLPYRIFHQSIGDEDANENFII